MLGKIEDKRRRGYTYIHIFLKGRKGGEKRWTEKRKGMVSPMHKRQLTAL